MTAVTPQFELRVLAHIAHEILVGKVLQSGYDDGAVLLTRALDLQ